MTQWIFAIVGLIAFAVYLNHIINDIEERWSTLAERFGLRHDANLDAVVGVTRGIPLEVTQRQIGRKRRGRPRKSDFRTKVKAELNRHWEQMHIEWRDRDRKDAQSTGGRVREVGDADFDRRFAIYDKFTKAVQDTLLDERVRLTMDDVIAAHPKVETFEINDGALIISVRWKMDTEEEIPALIEQVLQTSQVLNATIEGFDPDGQGGERADEYAQRNFYEDFVS